MKKVLFMTLSNARLRPLLLLLITGYPLLNAQEETDEVVELSPFTVETSQDDSYVASEAVTGSRVAVKIKDLPYVVNVVTSEFMDDFAVFELDELGYTSSLTDISEEGGSYNLRGYGSPNALYNGFFRIGLVDRSNLDRVEIIKGPSAAIYGQTSPGGLVNYISKKPTTRSQQDFKLTYGSYDTIRADVSSSGRVLSSKNTTYYFGGGYSERTYDSPYQFKESRNAGGVLRHKINDKSSIQAEFSWSRRDQNPDTRIPYIFDNTLNKYVDLARDLRFFSHNGPDSHKVSELFSADITYENRLNSVWTMRAAANWYDRSADAFASNSASRYDPDARVLMNRRPNFSITNEDGKSLQVDFLAHYWLKNGEIESKTLITFDSTSYGKYNFTAYPPRDVYQDPEFYSRNLSIDNPDYRTPAYSPDVYSVVSRENDNLVDVIGGFLRQQTGFYDGRLITIAGLRFDYIKFDLKNLDSGKRAKYSDSVWTPMIGANYKLTPTIATYLNYSQSFTPQAQSATAEESLPNETAEGWDAGFKTSFFEERLVITLGVFYIERDGVVATVLDEFGGEIEVAAGSELAQGVEFDFTWNASDTLTILGGYGYVDSTTTKNGNDLDSVGRWTRGIPHHNGGIAIRYKLPVEGLSMTAGIKYVGKAYTDPTQGGIYDANGFITSHDGRRDISIPGYTTYDVGLSYRFPAKRGEARHSLRLNIKNLFDKEYITTSRKGGDERSFYLTYSVRL